MPRVIKSFIDKTLKREIAIAMLVALFVLAWRAMEGEDAGLITARGSIVATLAWPVLSYAALAFGMEWVSKQTEWASAPLVERTPTNPEGEFAG